MWTGSFWRATAERAVRAFATSTVAVFVGDELADFASVDWLGTLQIGAFSAAGSVLLSLAASRVSGPDGGPSFGQEKLTPEPAVRTVHPDDPDRRI